MNKTAASPPPAQAVGYSSGTALSRVVRGACLAVAVLALIGGVFFFHEFLDRVWLLRLDPQSQDLVHEGGVVFLALVVAGLVVWIVKKSPAFKMVSSADVEWPQGPPLTKAERYKLYARWFIAMRWIAALFAVLLVFITVRICKYLPEESWWPLMTAIAVLVGCNLVYMLLLRWNWRPVVLLQVQGYVDLFCLVVMLHFSGGVEDILSMMMLFHVIIAGVLLSRRHCYAMAVTGSLLFALMALGEWSDVLEHYKLDLMPHVKGQMCHSTPLVLSWVGLQTVVLFLVAYFVTTLAERIRESNRQFLRQRMQYQRQVIAATEEERKRVARELHDQTGQALASVIAQLAVLETDGAGGGRRPTPAELRGQVEQTLGGVHELAWALRPSVLDDAGLLAALEKFCAVCSRRFGVTAQCQAVGMECGWRLPAEVEAAVYRIVQEGTNNAVRHGRARTVSVLLQWQDGRLLVVVEDDGAGFDATDWRGRCAEGDHLGLLGIEERAMLLGGTLRVESRPGAGTSLFVEIPLKDSDDELDSSAHS